MGKNLKLKLKDKEFAINVMELVGLTQKLSRLVKGARGEECEL